MRLVVIPPKESGVEFDDDSGIELPLNYDGVFFFLRPFLLELESETGQRVDPQDTAHFPSRLLPAVARHVQRARDAAVAVGETFEQHVGRQILPEIKEEFRTVSRETLLATLDVLASSVSEAQRLDHDLWIVGC